jgi:REP element-mobilizing transposase RayT
LLLEEPDFRVVAEQTWIWPGRQYAFVELDEFVIMPNHLHGIIIINDRCRGGSRTAPTNRPRPKPLGRLVGAFKTVSTNRINEMRGTAELPVWQRNYYEHIIRNEAELAHVRQYIADNPERWNDDPENPAIAS